MNAHDFVKAYGFANLDTGIVRFFEPVRREDPYERFLMPRNLVEAQRWVLRCKRMAMRVIARASQP